MYCPKCCKTIRKERVEAIRKELMEKYDRDPLGKGICPVCGTQLVVIEEERRKRDAR